MEKILKVTQAGKERWCTTKDYLRLHVCRDTIRALYKEMEASNREEFPIQNISFESDTHILFDPSPELKLLLKISHEEKEGQ